MLRIVSIVWTSFKMSVQELTNNKLRSALSLLGVAFGIFCIIGVLAAVDSMERKLQSDVKSFGSNTIYVDKWEYTNSSDYPWWKFVSRPIMKYSSLSSSAAPWQLTQLFLISLPPLRFPKAAAS